MEHESTSELNIVEADLADPRHAGAVVEMLDDYAKDIMGGGNPLSDEVRERLVDGLRRHPASMVFLAYQDRRPVGIAVCFLGFSTFAALPLVNIHDLAVSRSMRRRGIGRRLLESVQSKARELGCAKVTLEVRDDNPAAERLYRAFGFGDEQLGESVAAMRFLVKKLV
jgi:ribosomal protein S18 acetylase RimI-like enzyme